MAQSSPVLKRVKKELIIIAVIVALTFIVVVPLVYIVGNKTLGDYAGSPGMTGYIADVFRSLFSGDAAIWFVVLSPLLGLTLLRAGMGVARRIK